MEPPLPPGSRCCLPAAVHLFRHVQETPGLVNQRSPNNLWNETLDEHVDKDLRSNSSHLNLNVTNPTPPSFDLL